MDWARKICEPKNLYAELKSLKTVFEAKGYKKRKIDRSMCLRPPRPPRTEQQSTFSQVYLSFVPRVTDKTDKVLKRHNIGTTIRSNKKVQQTIKSAKDKRDPLSAAGSSYDKVYIEIVGTRLKENKTNCRLWQKGKSTEAEHAMHNGDYRMYFKNCRLLASVIAHLNKLVRLTIEIPKAPELV